jgi:glycosyltransferase involved in cell wall biosynthesis
VKLGIVVQRYGPGINGGAELHARYIAEHLARHAEVDVVTTCATDYVTWRNELPAGVERVNGITVRRFRVKHERDPIVFARLSERVFDRPHSLADEIQWLDAEGPASPSAVAYVAKHASDYDFWILFSYRYYHAFHAARAAAGRAVLVPTAERDPAIGLALFGPVFRGVRGLMYNSPEERTMIQSASGNQDVPSVVVGVGSEVPASPQAARFRQKYGIRGPFAIYVGRIDENKGCRQLFEYFDAYLKAGAGRLSLVLVGNSLLPVPDDPRIRHLGFLGDADKFDAIAAAELLIMPSYFESLSMVTLEAWALGRPVLANAHCDVLKGQCVRSNAGLYYGDAQEFVATLRAFEHNPWVGATLGRNGRLFYQQHYDWPVIEAKYLDMLSRLSRESPRRSIEPLPGWFARRRTDCGPASQVLTGLPAGSVLQLEPFDVPRRPSPAPSPVAPPPPRAPEPPRARPQRPRHGSRRGRPGGGR